jgi:hypothetical protein
MGRLKRLHINRHVIGRNHKKGEHEPVIGIEQAGYNKIYAHEVYIDGPCTIVYHPNKPLKCGARVWIETRAEVTPILTEE